MTQFSTEWRLMALGHYEEIAKIGRALANAPRLRILDLLRQGPRTVEVLAEAAHLSIANTSQHLKQLRSAGLIESAKHGQKVEYRLADPSVDLLFTALRQVAEGLLPEMDRLAAGLQVQSEAVRSQLLEKIEKKRVTLLDVRPIEEFRAGHLPGALSIPLPELGARLGELPKGKVIVAYCRGPYCPMALEAVDALARAGLRACHLDLGAADLAQRGWQLEVADGGARPSKPARRKT